MRTAKKIVDLCDVHCGFPLFYLFISHFFFFFVYNPNYHLVPPEAAASAAAPAAKGFVTKTSQIIY